MIVSFDYTLRKPLYIHVPVIVYVLITLNLPRYVHDTVFVYSYYPSFSADSPLIGSCSNLIIVVKNHYREHLINFKEVSVKILKARMFLE